MDSDSNGRASELFDYFKVGLLLASSVSVVILFAFTVYYESETPRQMDKSTALHNLSIVTLQVLCIRGFLAARKHADRILLLVRHRACDDQRQLGSSPVISSNH